MAVEEASTSPKKEKKKKKSKDKVNVRTKVINCFYLCQSFTSKMHKVNSRDVFVCDSINVDNLHLNIFCLLA